MFNFILNLFKKPYTPGLIPDPRNATAKAKDFQHNEVTYAVVPVSWIEKPVGDWIKGIVRDQDGSSSCVGQGSAKGLEMKLDKVYSAHPIYRRRPNFSGLGMYLQAAGDIVKNQGTTTEDKDPSQKMSEVQMNTPVVVDTPVKSTNYVFVDKSDIESIAQVIRDHKHCVLTFESNYDEWTDVPHYIGNATKWGHCVCSVDYTLYNGEKALIIDESWGVGVTQFNAQRVITKSFLQARGTGAMYFLIDTGNTPQKPNFVFTRDLEYGMKVDKEVVALQDALAYFGFLITDPAYHIGNYLQMTANAVLKWQIANNVAPIGELNALQGKRFGPKSRAKMNALLVV